MRPLLSLALLLLAAKAGAQDLYKITGVTSSIEGDRTVLRVTTSKPPNFTSFKLPEPPRLVIDFSEATFDGVAPEITIDDGVVTRVKTLSYGSDASAIARLMIGLATETDYDIAKSGNTLVVKVIRPASARPAVAAREPEPPPPAAEPEPAPAAPPPAPAREPEPPPAAQPVVARAPEPAAEEEEEEAEPPPPPPRREPPPPPGRRIAQADAPPARTVEMSSEVDRPRVRRGPSAMTDIGFRQAGGVQQVFVKTSERVTYSIQETGPNTVVLELTNTRIPLRNNRNHLDTRYFPGQVAMIQPKEARDEGTVKIEIQLKGKVPYEARQEEGTLYLDFRTEGQ